MNTTPKNETLFEKEPVWKAIAKMSIPAIVTSLVIVLYSIADMFFVGKTGDPLQIAAISLSGPIFAVLMALGSLIGSGSSAAIAKALGNKDTQTVKVYSSLCCSFSVVLGIVLAATLLFLRNPLLTLLGTTPEVRAYTRTYMTIITMGSPFILFANAAANVIRSEGAAKESMVGNGIATLINIVLDPLFILFFNMGVGGAAIATVIGNIAGCLYFIYYLVKKTNSLSLHPQYSRKQGRALVHLLALGLPTALSSILMCVSGTVSNQLISSYGSHAIAAMAVAGKAGMVVAMVQIGICMGSQPLLAYNYGAKNLPRTREIIKKLAITTIVSGVLLTLLCGLFREQLVTMFIHDNQVITLGKHMVTVMLLSSPVIGLYYLSTCFLQSAGNAGFANIVAILRQGIILIPLLYLLNKLMALDGLIVAQIAADAVSIGIGILLCIVQYRRLNVATATNAVIDIADHADHRKIIFVK